MKIIFVLIILLFCFPVFPSTPRGDIQGGFIGTIVWFGVFCGIPVAGAIVRKKYNKKENKRKYGKS